MEKNLIIVLLFITIVCIPIQGQTVVKMVLPQQAKEQLKVEVLFDEEIPEGMPVVLGLIGYKVTGGIAPYTFEWIQNGKVVGTSDIVIITPVKGDQFELKAIDKNKCYSTTAFNLRMIMKSANDDNQNTKFNIYPSLVRDDVIHIDFPTSIESINANVRIFNLKGSMVFQKFVNGNYTIYQHLSDGIYFISVQTDQSHQVEKIIVQH